MPFFLLDLIIFQAPSRLHYLLTCVSVLLVEPIKLNRALGTWFK